MSEAPRHADHRSNARRQLFGVNARVYTELVEHAHALEVEREELTAALATERSREQHRRARLEDELASARSLAGHVAESTAVLLTAVSSTAPLNDGNLRTAIASLLPVNEAPAHVVVGDVSEHSAIVSRAAFGEHARELAIVQGGPHPDTGRPTTLLIAATAGQSFAALEFDQPGFQTPDMTEVLANCMVAVVRSREARARAFTESPERPRPTLLAGGQGLNALEALLRARREDIVRLRIVPSASYVSQCYGLYGESAWSAALFCLADRLDVAARGHGSEAFYADEAFHIPIKRDVAGAFESLAQELADAEGIEVDIERWS